ncbi:odontogenesis associated phosphoprotein [Grammomys surdaster]|uniref:odontogenesis associated phosphoprotein n=1 Tax=Grammomys surdaster TaxID=491861 RepID=UPI0010A0B338|nr:odontogenesis associated phosphoprotein [Grammomys surdaster]
MAPGFHFSWLAPGFHFSWLLVVWLVVTMAEGQDVVTPPRGSQNNMNPTDCQIFTLTPPPTTRNPVTRAQPITRTPMVYFPPRQLQNRSSSEESTEK